MKTKIAIFVVIIVAFVVGLGYVLNKPAVSKYDSFAQCINDSGAKFYGAFWCPHCQTQKAMFGSAKKFLPYVECSNPDKTQTQVCIDQKIEGYPTWIFKDLSRLSGEVSFEKLAEKTQCVLPQ